MLAHGVTVELALSGQKFPWGQPAHTMFELVVQKDETYWPLAQVPQAVQLAALEVVEKLVLATQGAHTVLAVAVHKLVR